MVSPRKARADQFLNPRGNAYGSFSPSLVISAVTLLGAALQERKRDCVRLTDDHPTQNATGAIALIVSALDVWTVECLDTLSRLNIDGGDARRALARKVAINTGLGIATRFAEMASIAGIPISTSLADDLVLAAELRHEIIHHLVRPLPNYDVPVWLEALNRRGLFFSDPHEIFLESGPQTIDFHFGQKLCGYKLAYWCFETIETATRTIADGARPEWGGLLGALATNFSQYRHHAVAPVDLHHFDAELGLSVLRR